MLERDLQKSTTFTTVFVLKILKFFFKVSIQCTARPCPLTVHVKSQSQCASASANLRHCMMSQLCLYCLLLCFSAALSASRPPFSFQLHSFNDLRTHAFLHLNVACHLTSCFQANGPSCYPKLLLLFAPHCSSKCLPLSSINSAFLRPFLLLLQIDVQWLPPSLCSLQTRVTSHDSRGCFVLNHDTIGLGSRRTSNSTDDLITYLPALPLLQDPSRTTYMSLCFKGCGGLLCPCGASNGSDVIFSRSDDWLSLVDDLLENLNGTITKNALNVRIVLDGAANPAASHSACIAERWRPLPSLFTAGDGACTPFLVTNRRTLTHDLSQCPPLLFGATTRH